MIMIILMAVTVYPFWFSLVSSLNSGKDLLRGPVFLLPRDFTFASWRAVLADPAILRATWITASRTVIVTVISIVYTAMFAYAFSRSYLKMKRFYVILGFASMYFHGGLIPSFLLMNWLGLYDNYMVYILPSLFGGFYNVIIFNANYKGIPDSLFESAKMDGASEYRIFFQIVFPLSKPVLAALSVFTAVGIWNDYGTTLFFTQSPRLQTLQYVILKLIQSNRAVENMMSSLDSSNFSVAQMISSSKTQGVVSAHTIELAAMVLASLPMIILYPFAQRFFVKGVLLGSVKE
ncbi:carbohydrate ABC transporter permease [Paenibacillus sp. YN15]|uniref:carbohydrate ABC transporter permease n=1 Tax=Paenibacillus sp. YN15 TaxID=1742774 RepID=UPI00215B920D|nr:carbohydrate ABC transporter permease [Paenibacillus sp. YN15]